MQWGAGSMLSATTFYDSLQGGNAVVRRRIVECFNLSSFLVKV
jgi:hypothetical protein